MNQEYATNDDVNEVLVKNDVLKSELLPTEYLSEYRKIKDLLSYPDSAYIKEAELEIINNTICRLTIGYVEGSHFIFKYEEVVYEGDFTVDEQTGTNPIEYNHNINENLKLKWQTNSNTSSLYLLNNSNIILQYEMLSIIYPAPDELALKSQIGELKAGNESLKAMIATFESRLSALEKQ